MTKSVIYIGGPRHLTREENVVVSKIEDQDSQYVFYPLHGTVTIPNIWIGFDIKSYNHPHEALLQELILPALDKSVVDNTVDFNYDNTAVPPLSANVANDVSTSSVITIPVSNTEPKKEETKPKKKKKKFKIGWKELGIILLVMAVLAASVAMP